MDKTKAGWDQGWEVGMAGVQGSWGENGDNCTWTTIKQSKKLKRKDILRQIFKELKMLTLSLQIIGMVDDSWTEVIATNYLALVYLQPYTFITLIKLNF